MTELMSKEIIQAQTAFQIVSERIYELRYFVNYHEDKFCNARLASDRKIHERKKEWIQSLLDLNELIRERLKEMDCNRIH
jgi:hypothetical protein